MYKRITLLTIQNQKTLVCFVLFLRLQHNTEQVNGNGLYIYTPYLPNGVGRHTNFNIQNKMNVICL